MIELAYTRFIVTAWPDHRWPIELSAWIEQLMANVTPHRRDFRDSLKKKDRTCARNTAIKESALGSAPSYEWFVFADRDVRPTVDTAMFLHLPTDIKVCQVPMESHHAWIHTNSFHETIWCTSRRVLEAIEPPWFMQGYSSDGTELDGCICQSFRRKALEAGFSISHGGWAEHDRDGSWC